MQEQSHLEAEAVDTLYILSKCCNFSYDLIFELLLILQIPAVFLQTGRI